MNSDPSVIALNFPPTPPQTKDEYSIILTLTDNRLGDGNFVTQSLLLLVEDVNDNQPIFKPFQSALEIAEHSRPGIVTTVEATDLDEGAYGQVVYHLQELEGDNDVFSITTVHGKGVIRLVRDLDYEKKNLYQLRVLAVDRNNQGKVNTGTAALLIKVKDIEDQPPEFVSVTPVIRIPENTQKFSKISQGECTVLVLHGPSGSSNYTDNTVEFQCARLTGTGESTIQLSTRCSTDSACSLSTPPAASFRR